jgi:hypothetical protein
MKNNFTQILFVGLLVLTGIIISCKKKTDEIPPIKAPLCPTTKVYWGEKEDSLSLMFTLTVSENPREDVMEMDQDIDLAESNTRKAKYVYYNGYIVYYVYDVNGNEIGQADTTWGTQEKPSRSVQYMLGSSGYDTLIENYTYANGLLTSITSKYNSNPQSTTFFYYNGQDCIKKVYGSSSGGGYSDTTYVDYTYTDIDYNKDLLANKYGYVFFQFGNYGTKLLSSAVETSKSYCPWGSCGTNTNSELYEYKFEGNVMIQKLIRPGVTLYSKYEPICN